MSFQVIRSFVAASVKPASSCSGNLANGEEGESNNQSQVVRFRGTTGFTLAKVLTVACCGLSRSIGGLLDLNTGILDSRSAQQLHANGNGERNSKIDANHNNMSKECDAEATQEKRQAVFVDMLVAQLSLLRTADSVAAKRGSVIPLFPRIVRLA